HKTWPRYMEEAGYHTVNIQPGIKNPFAEGQFWGFDKNYYGTDLDYRGPEFGWFGIPDQFTLKDLAAREMHDAAKPLFAQIVLVSSHTPFYPLPPYRADWADVGGYAGVSPEEWARIYRQPDWNRLEDPYLDSLAYDLDVLGDFVTTKIADGALVVILGDEQPPAFISGAGQPWTVPIYVLSREPDLLAPFAARGYLPGAVPEQPAPWQGTESFLPNFLDDFSAAAPRLAAAPAAAKE
ncbi:MAG: sulfatase-like hydrolase/transferase, partial [Alphaproteobacteria bacterium]|nr:sulfatase-like hydrolase/transferase [Alphaproteobacteria bacterium]